MAGRGLRTQDYSSLPKPLIKIKGKPMIKWVIESLDIESRYVFITRKYDNTEWNKELNTTLNSLCKNPRIIEIDYVTSGPAASALLAKYFINNDEPLLITNSDQILKWDSSKFIRFLSETSADGIVTTWDKIEETESFIEIDKNGWGKRLVEKQIISNYPLNGIHWWKKGKYFIDSTEKMIREGACSKHNGEFYISESYNFLIRDGYKIGIYPMTSKQHIPVGRTNDIINYISNENS